MKLSFKVDSRNFNFFQKFGQVTSFPHELIFDSTLTDFVQPIGDVMCSAIGVCEVATDMTNKVYDHVELFNRIPSTKEGAEPKHAIKAGIEYLKLLAGGVEKPFNSYWQAHTGRHDAFDNCRSAIVMAQNSIMVWSGWYEIWGNKTILPRGDRILNYHLYTAEGWKVVNGVPMMQLEVNVGYKVYMTREVFNHALSVWASGTAVMSTSEIDAKRDKTTLEAIIDAYKNIIIILQLLINQQKVMPIPDPTPIAVPVETDRERLYNLALSLKGKYLTLNPTVPKNFNCAQCMSFILKKAGYKIPKGGISGTYTMYEFLMKSYTQVTKNEFSKGDIIISVTGMGTPGSRGHVGIYSGESKILSNDSSTGLLDDNWTLAGWIAHYETVQKMPTFYFRVK